MAGKRKEPIENLVRIPGVGNGPTWQDGVGNGYYEVRDRYTALLRLMFPTITTYEHQLPPVQRLHGELHFSIPHVPNIGSHYPIGFDAPYVQMTPEQEKAVSALYIEIGRAIQTAYKEGMRNGQNLLLSLAKGTVALSDFDEGIRVVEPKEEEADVDPESSNSKS